MDDPQPGALASSGADPEVKVTSPSASRSQGRPAKRRRSPQSKALRFRRRRPAVMAGSEGPAKHRVPHPVIRDGKAIYSYGNYDPYYKQRFDRYATVDPRVQALLQYCGTEIFVDKVVLDVGCNSGFISFLVAAVGARRVEGVDVDATLISKALKHLRWLKKEGHKTMPELVEEEGEKLWHQQQYAASCVQGRGHVPYHAKPLKAGALKEAIANAKRMEKVLPSMPQAPRPEFPYNIEFRAENFHLSQLELKRKTPYDVVLLLKLTQWIHLSYGDVGIQELFAKCHRLLRLGGLLVLEAQPWQKYLEKKHQTASRRGSHQNLILRPDRFSELLSQQGFEKEISVSPHQMPDAILVFRKVARVQAESPPLMTEVFQEQLFLFPRVTKMKAKVVPARFPTEAASSSVAATEAEATASEEPATKRLRPAGDEPSEP